MKTRLSLALAFLLMVVQGLWAQTPMTPAGENTWTAPMPAYQILLHAEYWGEYVISYELNGGINHEENPVKYYEDQEITLKKPTKEGYVFTGWTGSNGETPQTEVTIAQGSTGNKSYTAHWTEIPAPDPEPTPTVWTSLKVGDVIKVGDQLNPSEEWESANDYGVIKPAWAPYMLVRANIAQEHEWDDPVVTEAEDGAYYVFKFTHPTSGTCYLLANSAKSPLLAATATSDGLEVTNVGDDYGTPAFTFAVHDNPVTPTAVENVQTNEVQASKLMENGVLYIMYNGIMYNVQGSRVR